VFLSISCFIAGALSCPSGGSGLLASESQKRQIEFVVKYEQQLEGNFLNLTQVGPGTEVRVSRLECPPTTCQRLREMGFCENALVTKIRGGADLVCWVCGTRVALSARLAKQILVEHVDGRS
jgi:ferrous iron transport protein A